jgi:GT2 family glycosyltransferase
MNIYKRIFFDSKYYINENPDVKKAGINAYHHYKKFGRVEHRSPNRFVDALIINNRFRRLNRILDMNFVITFLIKRNKHFKSKFVGNFEDISSEHLSVDKGKRRRSAIEIQLIVNFLKIKVLFYFITGKKLNLVRSNNPVYSIIIPVFNKPHFLINCLSSIMKNTEVDYEVILYDNGSSFLTKYFISNNLKNIVKIRSEVNKGYSSAINTAFYESKGEYLIFLNSDASLQKGWDKYTKKNFDSNSKLGALGGKIINWNNLVQEVGSIIWKNGICEGVANQLSPQATIANRVGCVDYFSGAFFAIKAKIFNEIGKFDEVFSPAYYEETDLAIRLQEKGYFCGVDPNIVIKHFEFGSSKNKLNQKKLMKNSHAKFIKKNSHSLESRTEWVQPIITESRLHLSPANKILFFDSVAPLSKNGRGAPRQNKIINRLLSEKIDLMFVYREGETTLWSNVLTEFPNGALELISAKSDQELKLILRSRINQVQYLWVSRIENLKYLIDCQFLNDEKIRRKIIFDFESLDIVNFINNLIEKDISVDTFKYLFQIICLNRKEQNLLQSYNIPSIIIGHWYSETKRRKILPRDQILFVGNLEFTDSPNCVGLKYFIENIFPSILERRANINLAVVGKISDVFVQSIPIERTRNVQFLNDIENISMHYEQSFVTIAPIYKGGGKSTKIDDSLNLGIPCVTTYIAKKVYDLEEISILYISKNDVEFTSNILKLHDDQRSLSEEDLKTLKNSSFNSKKNIDNLINSIL